MFCCWFFAKSLLTLADIVSNIDWHNYPSFDGGKRSLKIHNYVERMCNLGGILSQC